MGFILGVLVLGALLSVIFGRRVGAMFVTGTATVVGILFAVLLILLSPLIWGFFTTPSHVEKSDGYTSPSYGASYSTPASGSGYTPVPPATAPTYQAPAASSVGASSPLAVAPTPSGPTIGITTQPADPRLSARFSMKPGFGVTVASVAPGDPAEQAGLVPGDLIQAMDSDPITANHTLADYVAAKGAGQTIRLSLQHIDNGLWVHKWITVTPR